MLHDDCVVEAVCCGGEIAHSGVDWGDGEGGRGRCCGICEVDCEREAWREDTEEDEVQQSGGHEEKEV